MNIDLTFLLQWWIMFFILGIIALPVTSVLFSSFLDKGYAFSKILGAIIISYFAFVLGFAHILPFSTLSLFLLASLLALGSIFLIYREHRNDTRKFLFTFLRKHWKIFLIEEFFFAFILIFFSFVRAFTPEINGLEKFMDFGFVNSILKSSYFPPKDMWLSPLSINYYYFGHLFTAVLTKLSFVPSNYSYNLMIASLAALCFIESFSLGASIYKNISLKIRSLKYILVGLLCAFLVTFSGNLHATYSLFKVYDPEKPVPFWEQQFLPNTFPNGYWYPNATRFIHNTIHEFPIYSWTVSDLHGHALDIPIVLTTIALLYSIFITQKIVPKKKVPKKRVLSLLFHISTYIPMGTAHFAALGSLLAIMYMTNAWDGLIYLLFAGIILFYKTIGIFFERKAFLEKLLKVVEHTLAPLMLLGGLFVLVSLPFSLAFKPFVSGVGVLCAPKTLTDLGHIGPFLFEADHCLRSPIWQLGILYGFFIFFIILFVIFLTRAKKLSPSDIFVALLIIVSTILIIIPEFVYAKDIYPAHYRANTMFKLVFESFIMLSLASGYIIARISQALKSKRSPLHIISYCLFFAASTLLLVIVFVYPYFSLTSFYGNIFSAKYINGKALTLDGTVYLKQKYPDDYSAILWMQKNITDQPVILEAQGDSYTDFGRVSANTGLPTVLGWTVHEWLWRGSYDIPSPRIEEIKSLYETSDLSTFKDLIHRYEIKYVFVGALEKEKYVLNETVLKQVGTVVFQSKDTRIYRL
ncbi:MAG: hypothetical protein KBC15_03955 [Candidatus Levybacteria bacterium]|nr:hypothetical protein [Candidatus Levybacteria bacterium]